MTAAAFDEYLQHDPALAALTGKLQPGVNGDLLINTVQTVSAKEVVAALQPYISGEVGLIGKLVIVINNFLASEEAARQKDKKGKKKELDEAKAQRLQDSMMKEQEGRVTSSTMQQLFQARKAQEIVDLPVRRAAARAEYEKNGLVFKITVPGKEHLVTQLHYKFYQENKKSLLQDLGFKLESSQRVAGGKTEDRIRVPGPWLKALFVEREARKEDLRLDGAHAGRPDLRTGPFGCTQFMSLIAQKRKDTYAHAPRTVCTTSNRVRCPRLPPRRPVATPLPPCHPVRVCRAKEVKLLVSKKSVEQLQALAVSEVSTATAKAGTKIDSARETLSSRLMDKEAAATGQLKEEAERLVAAARTTLKAAENNSLEVLEEINRKWAERIELRRAADVKIAATEACAKEAHTKATRRSADLASQAERSVQHDVLQNALKRRRTETQAEVQKFSGANLSAAYAAAAYGSWLKGSPAMQTETVPVAPATTTAEARAAIAADM